MPKPEPHEYAVHVGAQDRPDRVDLLELLAMLRRDWWDDAACRGQHGLMFPDRRKTGAATAVAKALELCAGCAVRSQCATAGLSESYGVWGGHFREPHRSRRMTVGNCLLDGRWWSSSDLALTVGRSEAHIRAQIKKLNNRWRIEKRTRGGQVEYRKVPE